MGIAEPDPRASVQLIQSGGAFPATPPLILIHDACGTIYAYHALGKLGRAVYGIENPRFESRTLWHGGIEEMAKCYHAAIKELIPYGDILLGGWSLGGVVALNVARLFAADVDTSVRGTVMIDSPFPTQVLGRVDDLPLPPMPPGLPQDRRQCLAFSMREAVQMLGNWHMPQTWTPPAAAMIRASDYLPGSTPGDQRDEVIVDRRRSQRRLGWEKCGVDFICVTYDAPGDHWSMFSQENIPSLTEKVKAACEVLETWE